MRCRTPRKGPRRPSPKAPVIDQELADLASVIAEYSLDNNAYGWFRPPWRDGQLPARLALEAARTEGIFNNEMLDDFADASVLIGLSPRSPMGSTTIRYEEAGKVYQRLIYPKVNTPMAMLVSASMRCLQLFLANSHGGGEVYNEVLIPAFLPVEPSLVENIVLEFRCLDAIGVTHHLRGDRNDRQRAAFTTAWRRGLYLAAYSLPPAF